MRENLLVGLDIGTTKICVLIAKFKENKSLEIMGLGKVPSLGVRKGVIVDIPQTARMVKEAIKRAEFDAGLRIKEAWVSIAGEHIQSQDNRGFLKINREDGIIRVRDVERVLEDASRVAMPKGREIIHKLPQEFVVDGQDQINEPLGMRGAHLEARVHLVTAASGYCQNMEVGVQMGGCQLAGMVLQSLASGMATLLPEEEDLGVTIVDIGGGTTDVAIFLREGLRFTEVLAVGGNHITNDLAVGLHITRENAEILKINQGTALTDGIGEDEEIEVERVAGRGKTKVKKKTLARIIELRVEEIFELVDIALRKSGLRGLITSGVVLSGGSSLLNGIKEKTEKQLNLPVRIGYPRIKSTSRLNSPVYATVVGLVIYALKQKREASDQNTLGMRIKGWLREFF